MNFRSENIVVSGNMHINPGSSYTLLLQFGQLLAALYGSDPSDSVVYDTIGEPMFDATVAANNSNANRICVGGNTGGTFASFNAPAQLASPAPRSCSWTPRPSRRSTAPRWPAAISSSGTLTRHDSARAGFARPLRAAGHRQLRR
jgi:hypothetical protein